MKPLILFDINGTLIKRDSRTDLPYEYAVNELLSIENGLQGVNTSARSDVDVMMEILQKHNVEYTEALWEQFFKLYIKQLNRSLPYRKVM
jgi:2-hydroxy-3-keto-5-methylthiopentenyl-1-phosphate phosphatase